MTDIALDEKTLEAAAIAAFRQAQSVYRADHDHFPLKSTWETTDESVREGWRNIARAVLHAGKIPVDEYAIATVIAPYFQEGYSARDAAQALVAALSPSPSQVAPQPQAGALDPRALKAARTAYQSAISDGCWHSDGGETDAPIRAAIAAYLASPQPANPAQVTDARVEAGLRAAEEACMDRVFGEFREDSTFETAFTDEFKEQFRLIHRRALIAAIGAGGQAVAAEAETLKARAASVLCEAGALCGWPAPNCNAREGAEALFKAGLLALSQPHPVDERVVEALDAGYLRETLAWVRRNFEDQPKKAKEQIDLALGHLLSRLQAGEQEGWRSRAADDVLAERRRQVEVEGWTPEHDNVHSDGQMAVAAACYAKTASMPGIDRAAAHFGPPIGWPWGREWWKPKDRRRDLVRAASLLIAEIERLDRLPAAPSEQGGDRG